MALENNSIPTFLTDSLIDSLPVEIWQDPTKKFCYASVVDDYVIHKFYDKLYEGLKDIIPNKRRRRNHILNNMLYAIALEEWRARLVKARSIIKNIYILNIIQDNIKDMPNFDFIIQNPPYGQSSALHLKFLEKGIELLSNTGKMIIIEPAIHLINIRHNKSFDDIKDKLNNITEKIIIDNYKKEFNSNQRSLFAITYINKAKTDNNIIYKCCGTKEITVNNIYDCNLIGSYTLIHSILNKVKNFGDMFRKHVVNHNKVNYSPTDWFLRFATMMPANGYYSKIDYIKHPFGEYYGSYSTAVTHKDDNLPVKTFGNKQSSKKNPWDCTFGNKDELTNLAYNNINTKLFCFIQCVMAINSKGNSYDYIPWLVDKQYTDEELYKKFNFTSVEIDLIEKTVKKYERYSPWFKRYMCGPSEVSDEEVQKFMNGLNNA